ncbi:DUF6462 family protein [Butyrivibrio sp. AE3009]|uniref:DUF6462 family protein n=1 Tax=Butyrivibrio sp. AE3009 TaxID=1280666 RepID=UPI001FA6BB7D|nr:DUF6462 family protein [Butyrivibrio sp. AE3009]
MLKSKSPPINLDEYLDGQHRHFVTYWEGAREIGIAYWSFVSLAKEANATIRMGRYVIVDIDVVNDYIEETYGDNEGDDGDMPKARKKIENLEGLVKTGGKKYVRIAEGAELYSVSEKTFSAWADDANAKRHVKGVVLVNVEKVEAFIESFNEGRFY